MERCGFIRNKHNFLAKNFIVESFNSVGIISHLIIISSDDRWSFSNIFHNLCEYNISGLCGNVVVWHINKNPCTFIEDHLGICNSHLFLGFPSLVNGRYEKANHNDCGEKFGGVFPFFGSLPYYCKPPEANCIFWCAAGFVLFFGGLFCEWCGWLNIRRSLRNEQLPAIWAICGFFGGLICYVFGLVLILNWGPIINL